MEITVVQKCNCSSGTTKSTAADMAAEEEEEVANLNYLLFTENSIFKINTPYI